MAGKGGGHCEYFATTMTILLRKRSVPCRMVTGFLGHEWSGGDDGGGSVLILRNNHAHAWVEVWDPKNGWATVDPTPARAAMLGEQTSLLSSLSEYLRSAWTAVTAFDGKSHASALVWAKSKLSGAAIFVYANIVWLILGAIGLFALVRWVRRRGLPEKDPAVDAYLSVLEELGLNLTPGETPRQLLLRATDLTDPKMLQLTLATSRHEALRYLRV